MYLSMKSRFFILLIVCLCATTGFSQADKIQLNHIAMYVTDLESSREFYRTVVGLDTIPEPFRDGRHAWFRVGPQSHLHLISGAKVKTVHDKNAHLCFSVADLDAFINGLDQQGVPYESWTGEKMKPTLRVDGVRQIYFRDPDGYWIEVNNAKE